MTATDVTSYYVHTSANQIDGLSAAIRIDVQDPIIRVDEPRDYGFLPSSAINECWGDGQPIFHAAQLVAQSLPQAWRFQRRYPQYGLQ